MQCAGAATAALAALALALVALLAGAEPKPGAHCEPDAYNSTTLPSCQHLADQYSDNVESLGVRCVSVRGNAKNVALVWGSDPARAAAALLHAVLRHALRYRRVRLRNGPHRIHELVKQIANVTKNKDPDLLVGISTAWEVKAAPKWITGTDDTGGLAGPRLAEFGTSSVAARCRLYARLAPTTHARFSCRHHTRWTFYSDVSELTHCAFIDAALNQTSCDVYSVDCNATMERLETRVHAAALPLSMHRVDRATLVRHLRTAKHSFLFLDYDIWEGEPNVSTVEPPPCVTHSTGCLRELDPAIAMRVGDVKELQGNAPNLFQFVQQFNPSRKSLRMILEREGNGVNIEEAACQWILNNSRIIKSWNLYKYDENPYWVKVFYCNDDPDMADHAEVLKALGPEINLLTTKYTIGLRKSTINCSDAFDMGIQIAKEAASYESSNGLMGIVAAGAAGAANGAGVASALCVPLLLVDAAPDHAPGAAASADTTWRVAGRPRHLARALQYFVRASGWTRLAVLSQETTLAAEYYAVLDEGKSLALRQYNIPLKLTELRAQEALQELLVANARIVFVNADADAAVVMLSAALKHHMSYKDGFVWIVRDWRPNNATSNATHFTVSCWRRGKEDVPSDAGRVKLRNKLSEKLSNRPWPPHTASLADALLTLIDGFNDVLGKHPASRQDLHTTDVIRFLNKRNAATPVTGITQLLHYKERSIEETFVFVDEWRGDIWHRRLATWRVNASAHSDAVRGNYTRPQELPKHDGASRCFVQNGDTFQPTCHDVTCVAALLLLLLLTLPALLLVRRRFG